MSEPITSTPVARSPIPPAPPTKIVEGWEISLRRSEAALRLTDLTPLAKVLVRAPEKGPTADALAVPLGRVVRRHRSLLAGSAPGEWFATGAVGTADALAEDLRARADGSEVVSVVDLTHGRALVRLAGHAAADLLSMTCTIDLSDRGMADGAALRTYVAQIVTDILRDDREGIPSYLLHCEQSSGRYLFESLIQLGDEFALGVTGFEDEFRGDDAV